MSLPDSSSSTAQASKERYRVPDLLGFSAAAPVLRAGKGPVRAGGAVVDSGQAAPLPGEVGLHFGAFLPILFAVLSAYPFERSPVANIGMAAVSLAVVGVRLHGRRLGATVRRLTMGVLGLLGLWSLDQWQRGHLGVVDVLAHTLALSSMGVLLVDLAVQRSFLGALMAVLAVIVSGLRRADLAYGLCLAGFVVTAPGLFSLAHRHETLRIDGVAWTFGPRLAGWARIKHLARALGSLLVTLGIGVGFHGVLPRPGWLPLGGSGSGPASALGSFQSVGKGPVPRGARVFLRVKAPGPLLLSAQVFDRFVNGRWERSPVRVLPQLNRKGRFQWAPRSSVPPGQCVTAVLEFSPSAPELLLCPEETRTFQLPTWHTQGAIPYHFAAWSSAPLTRYSVVYAPTPSLSELERTLASGSSSPVTTLSTPTPADREVPDSLDPRIANLASEWAHGATTSTGRIKALVDQVGRRCSYDSRADTPTGADGLAHFLFSARRGYCEHFASTVAVMARLLGIPSRLAVGYATSETAASDGRYEVRLRDAHAWVQVYIDGFGWCPVDATEGIRTVSVLDTTADWLADDEAAGSSMSASMPAVSRWMDAAGRWMGTPSNFENLAGGVIKGVLIIAALGIAGADLVARRRRRAAAGLLASESRSAGASGGAGGAGGEEPANPRESTPAERSESGAKRSVDPELGNLRATRQGASAEFLASERRWLELFDQLCPRRPQTPGETLVDRARRAGPVDREWYVQLARRLTAALLGPDRAVNLDPSLPEDLEQTLRRRPPSR